MALYECKVGKKPEKVCHLVFLEHVLLEEFGKKDMKKYLKEYLHLSLLWGTVQCTKGNGVVLLQLKIMPLVI